MRKAKYRLLHPAYRSALLLQLRQNLQYKENVPDTRESPVREMVKELKEFGVNVYGYDPLLSKEEMEAFGVKVLDEFNVIMDCVIMAVAHDEFKKTELSADNAR